VLTTWYPATCLGHLENDITAILMDLQVLELRDSIKDQIFTVECMHEVMREQQRALCSSSNQGLLSNSVEHSMVPLTSQKDCSFYLSKTKEFQLKSEVLVSKIWNVLRAYEASLSGELMCIEDIPLAWSIALLVIGGTCCCRIILFWETSTQNINR